jgi:hypothetical protein
VGFLPVRRYETKLSVLVLPRTCVRGNRGRGDFLARGSGLLERSISAG